ncbi:MAG: hypothetical protein K8R90_05180 [Candidatus Cloacimonetes bacterium]|nr:hypothetical protein [Candidatus Cloacimonadota bacterium]
MPESQEAKLKREQDRSVPADFDTIADTNAHSGEWYGLEVHDATFPDDATGVAVNGAGKNMSAYNGKVPNGHIFKARFTKITLTGGVATAYKG